MIGASLGGYNIYMPVLALDEKQTNFLALCNKNFATIDFMYKAGCFAILGGNAILSFDRAGALKSIKRELFDYAGKDVAY